MAAYRGQVLIYGGKGALGSALVKYFVDRSWWVGSIDFYENTEAHTNIVIEATESWLEQETIVKSRVNDVLSGSKIDALLCVAGGWAGGNAASKDLIKNADLMWKQSVWTSLIAASIGAAHLKEGGVLVLTGAYPALSATPGMIGYGLAKAAVHHLIKSLAHSSSGLPPQTFVSGILPTTLDTPMNRKFMPKADFTTWTPLETVAELLFNWSSRKDQPESGSLVHLNTKDGTTHFVTVGNND